MKRKTGFIFTFVILFGVISVFADGNAQRIREILYKCEQDTGVRITINNGDYDTRSARRQAELMADMSTSTLRSLYGNNAYTQDMAKVTATGDAKVNEFERIINKAR